MVSDTGIGIHKALTQTPGTKYGHFTKEESMLSCVDENITNGRGMGRGLFHTGEFIRENGGELIIYSDDQCLKINSEGKNLYSAARWQGTFIFLKINTAMEMDPNKVVNAKYNLEDNYDFLFGDIDELW